MEETIRSFLNWQFKIKYFQAVIFIPSTSLLSGMLGSRESQWPQVVLDASEVQENLDFFFKLILKGWHLILTSNSTLEDSIVFFEDAGLCQSGSSGLYSGEDYDLLSLPWNRDFLEKSFAISLKMNAKLVCCFGHDGEPIYLLSNKDLVP